ncbi:Os06g0365700, partial [Oryza sativa Japonica Group]
SRSLHKKIHKSILLFLAAPPRRRRRRPAIAGDVLTTTSCKPSPTAFGCCCFSFLQVRDDPICILYWFFVFNTAAARSASICGCCFCLYTRDAKLLLVLQALLPGRRSATFFFTAA